MGDGAGHGCEVAVTEDREQIVVVVRGELDLVTGPVLDRHLAAAVARGRPRVVVDLSGVSFVDVRGISSLVAAERAARDAGSVLVVRDPSRQVRRVIEVFGLDQLTD